MEWETVIGLEVHTQLKTNTKIFSPAPTAYGAEPNTQACAIDLGMPGVLPVLNKSVVQEAIKFGFAVDATINHQSVFARKNYFYADLPKGYQISQFELPIVGEGHLDIEVEGETSKRIRILRAHLEEDAGKSLHEEFLNDSGVDLNRAGTPLLEIVSEPDMRSAKEAVAYLKTLHALVVHLDISDGNMQEGSFRCDVNVSVRPKGETKLGTRTETKNLNSFRFVEKAIHYEVERQISVLENGGTIDQETRLFDPTKGVTRTLRSKEEAHDYRYFPDPDLLPLRVDDQWISEIKAAMPELPRQMKQRFMDAYQLNAYDASVLTSSKAMAAYFEKVVDLTCAKAKIVSNWITGELAAYLNKDSLEIDQSPITAQHLAQLLDCIADDTISGRTAKDVFEAMWQGEGTAEEIIEAKGLKQVSDSGAIETMIDDIMAQFPNQLEQYRQGKDKLFGFFVGQVMKATQGKANPKQLNELLKKKL